MIGHCLRMPDAFSHTDATAARAGGRTRAHHSGKASMTEGPVAVAERPSFEPEPDLDLEALKFRFGFLCHRVDEVRPRRALPKAGWLRERVGPFVLHRHPETRLARRSAGERHLVLLGDGYDVATGSAPDLAPLLAAGESGFLDAVDRLGGRFALLLVEGERLRALNDPIGSRSIYYHAGEPFCLGSHASLVARAAAAPRREDIPPLLRHPHYRRRSVKYLPGDWTIYANVFGLIPNNLYDTDARRTRRYWPRVPLRATDFEGFVVTASEYLRAQATFAGSRYSPLFGLTGGVDTRVVFASFRAFGVPFETVTWLGGRLAPGEITTVEQLAEYLDVPHRGIRRPAATDGVARIAGWNGGAYRGPARLTSAMLAAYGPKPARVFIRCWGGEVMRGFYNTRPKPMRSLAPAEMARAYGSGAGDGERGFRASAIAAFEEFFDRGNCRDLEGLGYDPNDLFYWEHRMGMWGAAANNELDPAMTTLIGLNSRHLFVAAFGLPDERRLTKRLLLELTDRFDPALARMPLGPGTPKNRVALDAPARPPARRAATLTGRLRRRFGI